DIPQRVGAGGRRLTVIGPTLGSRSSPNTRSRDSQVMVDLSTFRRTVVADVTRPSCVTPRDFRYQSSPTWAQRPAVYPPWEPNGHDLSWCVSGSQPIRVEPCTADREPMRAVISWSR